MIDTLLYNGSNHSTLMLEVDTYKQIRLLEIEVENCMGCPKHQYKSSDIFHCEYDDIDMNYRDISEITSFPKSCSLMIGSLIKV